MLGACRSVPDCPGSLNSQPSTVLGVPVFGLRAVLITDLCHLRVTILLSSVPLYPTIVANQFPPTIVGNHAKRHSLTVFELFDQLHLCKPDAAVPADTWIQDELRNMHNCAITWILSLIQDDKDCI
eukprot:391731-Pelagomonas_calceolata.AAC.1